MSTETESSSPSATLLNRDHTYIPCGETAKLKHWDADFNLPLAMGNCPECGVHQPVE